MSIMARQSELGRSIFEINTNTLKELVALQRENFEQYFSTNRSFGKKLPEVKDISGFVSLQREYGETLWGNVKTSVEANRNIVRGAFDETRQALKKAFASEEVEEEVTEEVAEEVIVKAASKSKAKAKSNTEAA